MQHSKHVSYCAIAVAAALLAMPVHAGDWPQYQGPNRTGISDETGIAREWPEGGPRVLWSHPVGEGFGGPAIAGGKVYVLDRIPNVRDIMRCYDLKSGEQLWESSHAAVGEVSHNGSRTTPTVHEGKVYAVGMTGMMYCIDIETHEPVFIKNLAEDYPTPNLTWGYAQSPIIRGDKLIVAPQSDHGFVVAFDKNTGNEIWASEGLGNPGYSTPVVAKIAGVDQVVMIATGRPGGTHGLSAEDGSILWHYDGWKCRIPIPFATPLPGDRLFITGEYGAGSAMIRIAKDGGSFNVEELYTTDQCGSQIHQPLVIGDYFYANSNGNSRNDGMICMSLEGDLRWRTSDMRELPRFERGGLLSVDGLIINLDAKQGTLHLIEPSPEGYRELASTGVVDRNKRAWAPMAISNGILVVRSQTEMKALDLRNP